MKENEVENLFEDDKPVTLEEPVVKDAEPAKADAPVAEPVKGDLAAPPAAPVNTPAGIPIQAVLDERDRRQKAERELEELRRWKADLERQKQTPDFLEDPEARMQLERQNISQMITDVRLQQSSWLAEKDFGKDVVEAALAYFDDHPHLSHQFLSSPSPLHAAVEYYKRQKVADEVGTDPAAYRAKIEAELRAKIEEEMRAAQQGKPVTKLPGSLAAAPSANVANETIPKGGAFEAAFGS